MKFVALLSGGKDSCFAAMLAVDAGHELVCLANLYPGRGENGDEINSFMYQSAAHIGIPYLAECFGKPLIRRQIKGKSIDQSLSYTNRSSVSTHGDYDEVEDLYLLLCDVKKRYPDIEGVCCGAIISNYQRHRVENVCQRLGLTSLSYLWERNRVRLLADLVDRGVHAVLVKVAGMGLLPHQHLGKSLAQLSYALHRYHDKYGLDVCGEGGEFETFVLDCPLFPRWRLVLDDTELILDPEDDSIGSLYLLRCHLEDKISGEALDPAAALTVEVHESTTEVSALSKTVAPPPPALTTHADSTCRQVPHFSMNVDGHGCTGLILGCTEAAAGQEENVVVQLRRILGTVCDLLKSVCGPLPEGVDGRTVLKDAIFVHVYLVDMALFPDVNALYAEYFGTVAPPSRACVAIPLPGGCKVALDVTFYLKSHVSTALAAVTRPAGDAAVVTPTAQALEQARVADSNRFNLLQKQLAKRRSVMHVSSVSDWAPVCIGPYSQCNSINADMVLYVAGQIGLDAATMGLAASAGTMRDEMVRQLRLCLQHCHRVLACQQCLRWRKKVNSSNVASVLLYISRDAVQAAGGTGALPDTVNEMYGIIQTCVSTYHGIGGDFTDAIAEGVGASESGSDSEWDENPDAESAPTGMCAATAVPVTVVEVVSLPRGALVEVEVLAVNKAKMGFECAVDSGLSAGEAVLDRVGFDPAASVAVGAEVVAGGGSDPLGPMYSLLGADARNCTSCHSSPPALAVDSLTLLQQSDVTSVGEFDLVMHHWKFQNCCAFGAIDCVERQCVDPLPRSKDTYYWAFQAILSSVRDIIGFTGSGAESRALKVADHALVCIKVFFVDDGFSGIEQVGAQAFRDIFLSRSNEMQHSLVPVVSFVPVCGLHSANEWLVGESQLPPGAEPVQCVESSGILCSCQFSATDTVQLKTMNWITVE